MQILFYVILPYHLTDKVFHVLHVNVFIMINMIKQKCHSAVSSLQVHAGGSEYLYIYAFQSPLRGGEIKTLLKRVEKHKEGDPLEPIRPLD